MAAFRSIGTLLLFCSPVWCQENSPGIRSATRLIEVQVAVTARHSGEHIRGLDRGRFRVFEDGRLQKVEHFDESTVRAETAARTPPGPLSPGWFTNAPVGSAEPRQTVALVVDAHNARFEDSFYAVKAAVEVLRDLHATVQPALYLLEQTGIRALHHHAADPQRLFALLSHARTAGDLLENGDVAAPVLQPLLPENSRHEYALRLVHLLAGLRTVSRQLTYLPGRKSIVLLSSGLPMGTVFDNLTVWKRGINEINDANVAVHAVDSSGLRVLPGFSADVATTRSLPLRGPGSIRPTRNNDILFALSAATGGRLFENRNDLSSAIKVAVSDTEFVYTLAYRPTHGRWNGRFVPLEVKVDVGGAEVRHRSGYFAVPEQATSHQARHRILQEVLLAPLDATGIRMQVQMRDSGVLVIADAGSLVFDAGDKGRWAGAFDVRFVQYGDGGSVLDDFTDEVRLTLTAQQHQQLRTEGFVYPRDVRLRSGVRVLKVAVCDHANGRVGSVTVPR